MGLMKQNFDVLLTGGVDTKTDDRCVIPSKLMALSNGRFVDKTTVATRPGFKPYVTGHEISTASDDPTNIKQVHTRGAEPVLEDATGLFLALPDTNKLKAIRDSSGRKAPLNRCLATVTGIDHQPQIDVESDIAFLAGPKLTAVVWVIRRQAGGGKEVWLRVDRDGAEIFRRRLDTTTPAPTFADGAYSPRVVAAVTGGRYLFHLYWAENTAAGVRRLKQATYDGDTFLLGSTTDMAGLGTNYVNIDAAWQPTEILTTGAVMVSYVPAGLLTTVYTAKLSPTDGNTVLQTYSHIPSAGVAVKYLRCLTLVSSASARAGYLVAARLADFTVWVGISDLDSNASALAFTQVDGGFIGADAVKLSVFADTITTGVFWVLWDKANAAGSDLSRICCMTAAIGNAGGGTPVFAASGGIAARDLALGVGLATDPWYRNGHVYVGVHHYSTTNVSWHALQVGNSVAHVGGIADGTLPVVPPDSEICARISMKSAAVSAGQLEEGASGEPRLPSKVVVTATGIRTTVQRGDDDLLSYVGAGAGSSPVGIDIVELDYTAQLNSMVLDDGLVLAGADPHYFDGAQIAELGFEYYPEPPILGSRAVAVGDAGTYLVSVLYEWTDKNGKKFQSAPSVPSSITLAASRGITILVRTLRLTRKRDVTIAVFVSGKAGTLLYRFGVDGRTAVPNDPTVDTIDVTPAAAFEEIDPGVALTAVALGQGELLYTTGGALANMAFPACKHVSEHQSRVVFTGGEDTERLQYTEEKSEGLFPGTNPIYVISGDKKAGRISATASTDDKLVVLQEKQLSGVFGRGPNRLGLDNNFSNIVRVADGYGHSWDRSNCITQDDQGIWFLDRQGLRHLDRSMQISRSQFSDKVLPAGAEVDGLIGQLSGAANRGATKQCYFANGESGFLVWDYQHMQWSAYYKNAAAPTVRSVAACPDGTLFFNSTDLVLWWEDPASPSDVASDGTTPEAIPLSLTTAWIKLSGLMGYQRIYRILSLLVDVPALSTHTMLTEYDYLAGVSSASIGALYDTVAAGVASSASANNWLYFSVGDKVVWPDGSSGYVTGFATDTDPILLTPVYNMITDSAFDDVVGGLVTHDEGLGTTPSTKTTDNPKFSVPRLELEDRVRTQKCEAIRFTYTHSSYSGGVRVTGLTLQCGVKLGTFKLPSSHRVA